MFDISLFPVLVATIVAMAIGMVWYSPKIFGTVWTQEGHIVSESSVSTNDAAWKQILIAAIQNFIIIYILAHFLLLADAYPGMNVLTAGVWMAILVAATQLSTVIWEKKSLTYFAITAGYVVTVLLVSSVILTKWPWA